MSFLEVVTLYPLPVLTCQVNGYLFSSTKQFVTSCFELSVVDFV